MKRNRRYLTIGFSIMMVLAAVAPANAQQCTQDRVYVGDPVQDTVYAFNVPGASPYQSYPGLPDPQGLIVDSAEATVYVADTLLGGVEAIVLPGGATVPVASGFANALELALSRDESRLYVVDVNQFGNDLSVVTLPAGVVTQVAGSLGNPSGVTLNAAETLAYVTQTATGNLVTVQLTGPGAGTVNPVASIALGLQDVKLSPSENFAYTTDPLGNLSVIDLRNGSVNVLAAGLGSPTKFELDQTGNTAWVVDTLGTVRQVDIATGAVSVFPISAGTLLNPEGIDLVRADNPTVFISDLPGDLSAAPGGVVTVPVNLTDVTGQGIQSMQADVLFDSSVLSFTSGQAGPLTSGCAGFSATPASPGTVTITASGCAPLAGAGPVALLNFNVLGVIGSNALSLANVSMSSINGFCTRAGALSFTVGAIEGNVSYYSNLEEVEDATVTLSPPGSTDLTDAAGDYLVNNAQLGVTNTLIAIKNGDTCNSVGVADAFKALQASALLIGLTPEEEAAGNVTARCLSYGSPAQTKCVTVLDALKIAQFSSGYITDFQDRADDWGFIPDSSAVPFGAVGSRPPQTSDGPGQIVYTPLSSTAIGQDWKGFVYGDINGSWSPCAPVPPPPSAGGADAEDFRQEPAERGGARPISLGGGPAISTFGFSNTGGLPGQDTVVGLIVDDATGAEALDVVIFYTPGVADPTNVALTPLTAGRSFIYNLDIPGEIHAGFYGDPIVGGGALLDITFESIGEPGTGMRLDLQLASIEESKTVQSVLNDSNFCIEGEGTPPAEVQDVQFTKNADGSTRMAWESDGDELGWQVYAYNVYGDSLVDLDDLGCLGYVSTPEAPIDDPMLPGQLSIYLIAAENCHGTSPLGSDNTRPSNPACP